MLKDHWDVKVRFAGAVKMLKATDAEQAAGDMLPEDGRLCPLSYGITENVCH